MQDYLVVKAGKAYYVMPAQDVARVYLVSKPAGKVRCTCPDYKLAPIGTCEHIEEVKLLVAQERALTAKETI